MNDDRNEDHRSKQCWSRRHGKAERNATSSYSVTTEGELGLDDFEGSEARAMSSAFSLLIFITSMIKLSLQALRALR